MDTISLNGEIYVKAGSIARELGYTADYVGQLCRSGKVKAELVGRSWYVAPDSLKGHKKTRYRSSAEKSKAEVRKVIEERQQATKSQPKSSQVSPTQDRPNFYRKNAKVVSYEEDVSELIPMLRREKVDDTQVYKRLTVSPADAEKVKVKTEGGKYTLETTDLPNFTLQGTLDISDADPDPKSVKVRSADRARKVSLNKSKKATGNTGSTFRDKITTTGDQELTVPTATKVLQSRQRPQMRRSGKRGLKRTLVSLTMTLLVSLSLAAAAIGFEQHISIAENSDQTTYQFNAHEAFNTLKSVLK